MENYKGKSKCKCGLTAKYRSQRGWQKFYACEDHKSKIVDIENYTEEERMTEADYQTWERL